MKILAWILASCLMATASEARPGDFRVIGPGGGGAMFHPTFSPHDPNTALIACDMTGSYITHDGGKTWRMFNLRGTTKFFAFDPLDSKIMYAQVTGLWRSTDGGETWQLVYPKPSTVTGIRMSSDHSDEIIQADPDPLGTIQALAIDPADSKTLFAAADGSAGSFLFVSHDFGDTWTKGVALPKAVKHIYVDPQSPHDSRTVLILAAQSVVTVKLGTAQEGKAPEPVTFIDSSAGFDTEGNATIYATAKQGIFVSTDDGQTWHQSSLLRREQRFPAVATSLRHPKTAYVSYENLHLDGHSWMGVAKTTDSGRNWTPVWKEPSEELPGVAGANIHDAWITPALGSAWGGNPLELGVADQDANLAYGTDLGRAMLTSDGGKSWNAVYSRKSSDAGWTSTGLNVTTSYGVHFDPFDSHREFITYTDIGLFRSEDGGKSWMSSTRGVPEAWRNTTYWIAFDPKVRGRMWSVNSGTHDLPRPKMWRTRSVTRYHGGVCRSEDGGQTWVPSNHGMEETAPTHILLDPESPVDARVLYVAAFGRGVYKSTDGGKNWSLKNNGITQTQPFAWRLIRDSQGALYVLIARRSEDGGIGNAGDGALYRSTDAAESWTPVSLPKGANAPNGLAVDPQNPKRLYLATWARAVGMHGEGGGIYLSEDGGANWRVVLDRDRHVYDVSIDPRDASVLYAAGFESSAWRSSDRGEHWTRIPGFNFKWGHRVIPDPADGDSVYITTFGGSVWHGAVNGEARPVDIATPVMEPGR